MHVLLGGIDVCMPHLFLDVAQVTASQLEEGGAVSVPGVVQGQTGI